MSDQILFIYNADSGALNLAIDFAHKILSPTTYNCQLCNLTYGLLKEKRIWKEFRDSTKKELLFLYKDEFELDYKEHFEYPVILRKNEDELEVLMSRKEINGIDNVSELVDHLKQILI